MSQQSHQIICSRYVETIVVRRHSQEFLEPFGGISHILRILVHPREVKQERNIVRLQFKPNTI